MISNLLINSDHKFFELSQSIKLISTPLFTYLGISHFAFKRTFLDGSKIYLFNNPAYYEHYFFKKYFLIGNREAGIENYTSSYDLWDCLPDPQGIYKEAFECFNIAHGLTITKRKPETCDFFFFGTNRENLLIKNLYVAKREVFDHFCEYFLSKAEELIATASLSRITLPYNPCLKINEKILNLDDFIRETSNYKIDWAILTKKELNCVHFLARGKSNKEIARELNISPRTVEDYVSSIRCKTNCKSKSELISTLCKYPLGTIYNF